MAISYGSTRITPLPSDRLYAFSPTRPQAQSVSPAIPSSIVATLTKTLIRVGSDIFLELAGQGLTRMTVPQGFWLLVGEESASDVVARMGEEKATDLLYLMEGVRTRVKGLMVYGEDGIGRPTVCDWRLTWRFCDGREHDLSTEESGHPAVIQLICRVINVDGDSEAVALRLYPSEPLVTLSVPSASDDSVATCGIESDLCPTDAISRRDERIMNDSTSGSHSERHTLGGGRLSGSRRSIG